MSIFNVDATPTTESTSEPQTESFLEQLVAKKGDQFRDPEALAKKALHADDYIEQLKAEKAQLETYKELIEGLKKDPKAGLEQLTKPKEEPLRAEPVENTTPTGSDIESQLEALLEKRTAKQKAKENLDSVEAVLAEQFGETAKTVVHEKAKELGFSVQRLAELAAESPKAFLNLVGVKAETGTRVAFGGSVNTGANAGPDKDSFEALMKEFEKNPKLVYDHTFNAKLIAAKQRERDQRK